MTIEDETDVSNLIVFQNLFESFRKEILQSRLIMAEGTLQKEGEVIHVIVKKFADLSVMLRDLTLSDDGSLPLLTLSCVEEKAPQGMSAKNKPCQIRERAFPDARNFR